MKWLLILIAVHIKNPADIPARVMFEFDSKEQCEKSLSSMEYWVKFESFKLDGKCIVKKSS
jgi:hypothetical protein